MHWYLSSSGPKCLIVSCLLCPFLRPWKVAFFLCPFICFMLLHGQALVMRHGLLCEIPFFSSRKCVDALSQPAHPFHVPSIAPQLFYPLSPPLLPRHPFSPCSRQGGEPDLQTVAKMLLLDWQRGKIPFFKLPPDWTPDEANAPKTEDSKKEAQGALEGRKMVAEGEDRGVKRKDPPSGDVKMVADKKGEWKRMKREGEGEGEQEDAEEVAARRVSAMLKAVSRKQQKEKLRVAADFFDEEDERGFEGMSGEEGEEDASEEEGEVGSESEEEREEADEDGLEDHASAEGGRGPAA